MVYGTSIGYFRKVGDYSMLSNDLWWVYGTSSRDLCHVKYWFDVYQVKVYGI